VEVEARAVQQRLPAAQVDREAVVGTRALVERALVLAELPIRVGMVAMAERVLVVQVAMMVTTVEAVEVLAI
jgi:hypothetical protein